MPERRLQKTRESYRDDIAAAPPDKMPMGLAVTVMGVFGDCARCGASIPLGRQRLCLACLNASR